jgi:hypothetical protein
MCLSDSSSSSNWSLTDRAFPGHKTWAFNLLAGWKTVPDNQWLPVGWVGRELVGISHTKPVGNIWPKADMSDFQ